MKEIGRAVKDIFTKPVESAFQTPRVQATPIKGFYRPSEIYSEEGLDRELEKLSLEIERVKDKLTRRELNKMPSVKEGERLERAFQEADDARGYLTSLNNKYHPVVELYRAGKEQITVEEFCRYQILCAGVWFLIRENFNRAMGHAKKIGLVDILEPYVNLQGFGWGVGRLDIKFGGVSWVDVLGVNPKNDGTAVQYKFLVDALLVLNRKSHEAVFKKNNEGLFSQYPNYTKHMIEGSAALVKVAIMGRPDLVDDLICDRLGIETKVAQKGKEFLLRVAHIREEAYRNILNPNSLEFPYLKEALSSYLKQGRVERVLALSSLGIDSYHHALEMYRSVDRFRKQGIESSFYGALADSITEYLHGDPTDKTILHEEDVDELLETKQAVDFSPIEVESLGPIIASIFSKQSQRVFDNVDPVVIDSVGLPKPQTIVVAFDQNRPQKFTVSLEWENDLGESTYVNLDLDTKKNLLDWNFIKSPDHPDMRDMRAVALKATQAILVSIEARISKDYQQKQREKNVSLTSYEIKSGQKKERAQDPIYAIRKQARQKVEERNEEGVLAVNEVGVKKQILLSNIVRLQAMLDSIHSGERENLLKAIDRFNNEGVGQFTRKHARGQNGEVLYTLRIGSIRVLLYEAEARAGIRQFVIKDIDYRSRIYRKNKM